MDDLQLQITEQIAALEVLLAQEIADAAPEGALLEAGRIKLDALLQAQARQDQDTPPHRARVPRTGRVRTR